MTIARWFLLERLTGLNTRACVRAEHLECRSPRLWRGYGTAGGIHRRCVVSGGGQSAAWSLRYQYLRTLEALMCYPPLMVGAGAPLVVSVAGCG